MGIFLERLKELLVGIHSPQRLASLVLVGLGWLLSPLCWWNDLLFNLPLALGFAKLVEMWYPDAFLPALVVGYWLSNVVGIVLMQSGAMGLLSGERTPDRGRELLVGLLTSSLYTVAVFGLVRMGWLRVPLDLLDAVSSGHAV